MLQCTCYDCNYFTKNKAILRSHIRWNCGKYTLVKVNSCSNQRLRPISSTETMMLKDDNIHIDLNKDEEELLLTLLTLIFIIENLLIPINESNQLLEENITSTFYDKRYIWVWAEI